MQPLGDVLQNTCSTPLLKNNWTIPTKNFIAVFFTTDQEQLYFTLDLEFQAVEVMRVPRVLRFRVPTVSEAPEVLGVSGLQGILKHWRPRGPRSPGGPGVSGLGPTFLPCLRKSYKNLNMYQKFSKSMTHINSKFRCTYWEVAILTRGQIFRK